VFHDSGMNGPESGMGPDNGQPLESVRGNVAGFIDLAGARRRVRYKRPALRRPAAQRRPVSTSVILAVISLI
jgi:hypothetical protein